MRLWYLFWAVPLFLAGCQQPQQRYAYRPSVIYHETATVSPGALVLDNPAAPGDHAGFGYDVAAGVPLNQRPQFRVTGGYVRLSETIYLRTRYYDHHPDGRYHDGYLNRTAWSRTEAIYAR